MHTGTGDLYHNEIGGDAYFGSNPGKQVINYYHLPSDSSRQTDSETQKYLKDLSTTDPREDKVRIEQTKGGLLKDSNRWILEHSEFQQWRTDPQKPLLWIKGDPGKGKTMLLCGIIDEMRRERDTAALLSYFFCQATDSRLNNATAVLRGLIFLLIDQQPSLISHVRNRYNQGGKNPFEGVNAWVALSIVFENILKDLTLQSSTYLIVDALDECDTNDLPQLLNLVTQSASRFPCVKWIVSSRNKPDIEALLRLDHTQLSFSLELNEEHVSRAVEIFIDFRVSQLPLINDDSALQETVRGQVYAMASGTFLWVALVLRELELVEGWDVLDVLREMPSGLRPLYHRMIQQIDEFKRKDPEFCRSVLSTMILAYRPLHLLELGSLSSLPEQISNSPDHIAKVVRKCGSFLTIRQGTVYFIHQSAEDYLLIDAYDKFFSAGSEPYHYTIFSRSLQAMSKKLRRDIYSLKAPGISIDQVKQPDPDPLAAIRYSCLYWVDHLLECNTRGKFNDELEDGGPVYRFLRHSYLYWLEALSLMRSLPSGIVMIRKIENRLQADKSPDLFAFIYDAKRFALYSRTVIEQAPLQLYCSALIFAPEKSIVRETFEKHIPTWVERKPRAQVHWSAALQKLEGHSKPVSSVAFSPDGTQVVSGSYDKTVRLWDAASGAALKTLEGHSSLVSSVAFSPNGKQIVSGSFDNTVQLWDVATGAALQTLKGHLSLVNSVAFSPDGTQVVSGSYDKTVRLWDAATGAALKTLEGHSNLVSSVAFSPDGTQVISGSGDNTAQRWDVATGAALQTLKAHSIVNSVAFSPNGTQVVSGSDDKTVRLWDAATGAKLQTLKSHLSLVRSVAFSPDSTQVVSGSFDNTVQLWDAATGAALQTLKGHSSLVSSVAFSPDGTQIVSGSYDNTVQLWDAATGAALQALKGNLSGVNLVAFRPDGTQVELEVHSSRVYSVAFSPDGTQVVSGSDDNTVRLWDAATGAVLQTLEGHSNAVYSVAFSSDGTQVVSGSYKTVRIWDAATGAELQKLEGQSNWVYSVAFSPDGTQVVSSDNKTVRLWDAATGAALQTVDGNSSAVSSVAFLPEGKLTFNMHILNEWVCKEDENILWLHPDYRSTRGPTWHNRLVIGHSSGRISVLQIQQGAKLTI